MLLAMIAQPEALYLPTKRRQEQQTKMPYVREHLSNAGVFLGEAQ